MYEVEKVVNVKAFHKNREQDDLLGWCWKPIYVMEDGRWVPTGKKEQLFGRVSAGGEMTHMAYTLNTSHHKNWNEWLDDIADRRPEYPRFYFDAGSNGHPIYVTMDEMRRAMIELGLYKLQKS
jgi:hypothetical protein